MAADDLCTVQNVKDLLSVVTSKDDAYLQHLVSGASKMFCSSANLLGVLTADYLEVRNGKGNQSMPLRNGPVKSATSLIINGREIPASADGVAAGYVLVGGIIHLIGYVFTKGFGNVRVSYSAGYDVVPADISVAVAEMAALKYRRGPHIDELSSGLAGQSITYRSSDIPSEAMKTINNYKNRGLVE